METKELIKAIKRSKSVTIIFHESYVKTTKKAMLELCRELPNKNDWEYNSYQGQLFIE